MPAWAALPPGILLIAGGLIVATGSPGMLRLPNFYARMHPPTMGTTLGTGCVLIASMLVSSAVAGRPVLHELLITLFVVMTTPVSAITLMRAAIAKAQARRDLQGCIAPLHCPVLHRNRAKYEDMEMGRNKRFTDAEMRARALARWEGEGGALAPTTDSGSIDESELKILARLGAAVLDEWGQLSMRLQAEVVRRAKALGTRDHARVKERLSRLLHDYGENG